MSAGSPLTDAAVRLTRRELESRTGGAARPAPVRIVHLGLGAFARAWVETPLNVVSRTLESVPDGHNLISGDLETLGQTERAKAEFGLPLAAYSVSMTLFGVMVMLGQSGKPPQPLPAEDDFRVYAYVADPDAHHDRAVAAGARVVHPLTDQPYGSREYGVRDSEGNVWSFGTYRP